MNSKCKVARNTDGCRQRILTPIDLEILCKICDLLPSVIFWLPNNFVVWPSTDDFFDEEYGILEAVIVNNTLNDAHMLDVIISKTDSCIIKKHHFDSVIAITQHARKDIRLLDMELQELAESMCFARLAGDLCNEAAF